VEDRRLGPDSAVEPGLLSDVQEGALIERARDGDTEAYGELVRRHQELAIRVAGLSGSRADVEDAVQEAFVKAYYALPRFRTGMPFRPWLCRIVANEAKNRARSARRRDALALRAVATTEDASPSPEATAIAREDAEALVTAMNRMKPDDRLIIGYRWLLDLSETEMAAALGVPAGTVKSRLSRAMTRLRTELATSGGGGDP
jgi:RNA polymerase sigma-70 factor (ECF subfamily)